MFSFPLLLVTTPAVAGAVLAFSFWLALTLVIKLNHERGLFLALVLFVA